MRRGMLAGMLLLMCGTLLCLAPLATSAMLANGRPLESRHVGCGGGEYRYILSADGTGDSAPALLILHGAGDRPEPMVEAWRAFAAKEKIVLIAPEIPRDIRFEPIAPQVFRCIVEDAKQHASIDPQRVYVFGHSMGGYLAYDAAMFDSEYFAAVAVHGMMIADDYSGIVNRATRKTPIAIYMGKLESADRVDGARKTRALLQKNGFPVHYVEIEDHDHNYYALSGVINKDAWNFLKKYKLPAASGAAK